MCSSLICYIAQRNFIQMQYLVWLAALIGLLATAYAIRCYSCESVYDANCGEDFDTEKHFQYDCTFSAPPRFLNNELVNRNATGCLKRVFRENGVQRIVRGCYFGELNETEIGCRLDPMLIAVKNASCHVCNDENYCNAGPQQLGIQLWKLASLGLFVATAQLLHIGQRDV